MLSTSSQKVAPVNEPAGAYAGVATEEPNMVEDENLVVGLQDLAPRESQEHDFSHEDQADNIKFLLKQVAINRQIERFQMMFTYDYIKSTTLWLLESASCKITISFEDITLIMTLFVLFGDDIRLLCARKADDSTFMTAYAVCLFVFIFEWLANTWAKTTFTRFLPYPQWEGFFLSFFWWLDLVALLSLFPDINFIAEPLGIGGFTNNSAEGDNYERAGRVIRLVRLVRLVRVYKVASEKSRRAAQEEELLELVRLGVLKQEDVDKQRGLYDRRQSRLGDQLSESTTRRVIVMILVMLVILPLLMYTPPNEGPAFATKMLHKFHSATGVSDAAKQSVLDTFVSSLVDTYSNRFVARLDLSPPFPQQTANPYVYYESYYENLRSRERLDEVLVSNVGGTSVRTVATFSFKYLVREQSTFSILMTIFVAIMMVGGALVFTNDAETMVIAPIERMMNMVERAAADPLAPLQFEKPKNDDPGQYETRLLESTIEKITGLLRVGFGEAGAGIISANLSSKDSSTAINPLLPGVRVYAIFGFCDIHHFEDINRKLANDVLKFVNCIAEIVHSSVHAWSGQCNKNLGNAFVIVWRIGDEHSLSATQKQTRIRGGGSMDMGARSTIGAMNSSVGANGKSIRNTQSVGSNTSSVDSNGMASAEEQENQRKKGNIDLRRVPGVDILADQALIGYCKIIAEINRNKYVMRYRNEPRLTERGTHEFKVRMGFGLHAGWAIEGAVGSLQKVDATYLSPHVNMAARLETSSKQYGVPLLASQDFYDLLSNEGQAMMRRLDVVTVKGSEVPIGIYTYDALQDQEFKEDAKRQRPSLNTMVVMNQAMAGLSTKNAVPTAALLSGASSKQNGSTKSGAPSPAIPASVLATLSAKHAGSPGAGSFTHKSMPTPGTAMPSPSPVPTGGNIALRSHSIQAGMAQGSPVGSGTSTPARRPSTMLLPGTEKPAVFLGPEDHTGDVFEQDYDMITLRKHATDPEFQQLFKDGITAYLDGDWPTARKHLERADLFMKECAPALGGDGPSRTLLEYMGNQNFEAPKTWQGFRPLTSK